MDVGDTIDMYKDMYPSSSPNPYYTTVVGILHTGGTPPTPPEPPTPSTDDNIEILVDCVIKNKKRTMKIYIE